MSQPTLPMPPEIAAALSASRSVTLTGPDGQPAAHVVCAGEYQSMRKVVYDRAFAQISADDVRKALANPKRHTTEEVWKLFEEK